MIKKEKREGEEKYILYTKDGDRELGVHDTRHEAIAQEYAIQHAKKRRRKG